MTDCKSRTIIRIFQVVLFIQLIAILRFESLDVASYAQAPDLAEMFPDFEEHPPYDGDCTKKPFGTVCVSFADGYTWLIRAGVMGSRKYTSEGYTVTVVIGSDGYDYHHVHGTKLVKKVNTGEVLPFDVDQWLNGPDREDFSWDVRVSRPNLTLQQRYKVEITANFDGGRLRDRTTEHDLHFVLKVATEDNNWVPGYSHTRILFPLQVDKFNIVVLRDYVYLRPGSYTIALIAYDPILSKGNVWRKRVKVSPLRGDKLPELDRDLPYVEFPSKAPHLAAPQLAGGREWLPVKNNRSLCIDIVVNTSMDWDHKPDLGVQHPAAWQAYARPRTPTVNLESILQVASVLSHLEPREGRVRVSVVDTLRMKTLADREDAGVFDWLHVSRRTDDWQNNSRLIERNNRDTIDDDWSSSQPQACAYLLEKLQEILDDNACMFGTESTLKIVILVSTDMVFPENTTIDQIAPQDLDSIRFFHFKIPKGISADDDLQEMLKQTKPRKVTVRESGSFRKDLADLISRLEQLTK